MNDLNQQLKNVCDKRQNDYRNAVIAEIERIKSIVPRARTLISMATELKKHRIPLGKRLSLWFRLTHFYTADQQPKYEFGLNGRYGIGFEHYYLNDTTITSRFKNDYKAEVSIYPNGTIDIHGPHSFRITITAEQTVAEGLEADNMDVDWIITSKKVAIAIRKLISGFDEFEHEFNEYVKTVIRTLGGEAGDKSTDPESLQECKIPVPRRESRKP